MTLETLTPANIEVFQATLEALPLGALVVFSTPDALGLDTLLGVCDDVAPALEGRVRFFLCDPRSCPDVAHAYQIERVPDVLMFDGDAVRERLSGITTPEELLAVVAGALSRSQRTRGV